MGGRRGARTQRRHFAQSRDNVWKRSKSAPRDASNGDGDGGGAESVDLSWQPFATQNPSFDEYYKEQGIVSAEEWDTFIDYLRKPLPAAFRINSSRFPRYEGEPWGATKWLFWDRLFTGPSSQFCTDIRLQLENDFMRSLQSEVTEEGEQVPLRPLAWYPEHLAWHSNFSRMQLRKNQSLERFHEFLKLENEIGNITRQEAVSMVPPLFLDVHSDHFVLDMCAAPGSKTFQLLEIIHQGVKPGFLPDGLIVANDLDVQRCNLLIHQTKRMCTASLIVTNHEAQQFPGCRVSKGSVSGSDTGIQQGSSSSQLLFDRVLCDVPCSGDGTLRKAPDIWRKWHPGMGNGIHGLQVQIAMRGMSLLKVGGRMVYSTCSMNPVEDEAVVAEILRRCGGSVALLDVSNELPQLVRRPGLRKWKLLCVVKKAQTRQTGSFCFSKSLIRALLSDTSVTKLKSAASWNYQVHDRGVWLASYADVDSSLRTVIMPSMFPQSDLINETGEKSEFREAKHNGSVSHLHLHSNQLNSSGNVVDKSEEVSSVPLERCMRIVPHDQNGGAFFIAVLHKVADLPVVTQKIPHKEKNSLSDSVLPEETKPVKESKILPEISTNGMHRSEPISDICLDDPDGSLVKPESSTVAGENDSKDAEGPSEMENDEAKAGSKRKLQMQGKWRGVDPVVIFKDEAVIDSIKTFYGISDSFPFTGRLVTRNNETSRVKRIYYVSNSVRDLLDLNFKVGEQLKITSIGLKMFERQTSREGTSVPCSFRISSEGLPLILPHITKQILHSSTVDFKHLLQYKSVKFGDFVDAEFGEKASQLLPGCCVIVLKKDSSADAEAENSSIAIGCWRGRASLSVMVTAIDCQELLERLLTRAELKNELGAHEKKPLNEINHGGDDKKQEEQLDETTIAAEG